MGGSGDSGLRFHSLLSVSQIFSYTIMSFFFRNDQHQGTRRPTIQLIKVLHFISDHLPVPPEPRLICLLISNPAYVVRLPLIYPAMDVLLVEKCFLTISFSYFLGRSRFFRFRQAALSLMNTNKQSLPQEDPDAVMVDSPKENEDSVALQSFPSPTKSICTPTEDNDLHGLISSSHHSSQASISPEPVDHSSPKLPWEKLYMTEAHQTSSTLSNTFPRGSINSMRRASSVHEIEGYSNSKNIFRDRHTSEGMWHQHRPQARVFKSRPRVAADFKRRCFLNACRCNKKCFILFCLQIAAFRQW